MPLPSPRVPKSFNHVGTHAMAHPSDAPSANFVPADCLRWPSDDASPTKSSRWHRRNYAAGLLSMPRKARILSERPGRKERRRKLPETIFQSFTGSRFAFLPTQRGGMTSSPPPIELDNNEVHNRLVLLPLLNSPFNERDTSAARDQEYDHRQRELAVLHRRHFLFCHFYFHIVRPDFEGTLVFR